MKFFNLIAALVLGMFAVSCNQVDSGTKSGGATPPAVTHSNSGSSDVVAIVNGVSISDAELYNEVKGRLKKVETEMFNIKRKGLTGLIENKILEAEAKKRGIAVTALIQAEVNSKVSDPSDAEISSMYNKFKSRLGNQPLEKVKPRIIAQLKSEKQRGVYRNFVNELKKQAKVEIKMSRPRVEVSADDDPFHGPKDAPITIIEFSEFQCPFCKRTLDTLDKIKETYKGKVKHVFRDFPLSFHKQAPKAAEAANCAGEQDKYWEYNRKLFDHQRALQEDKLKSYAKELGLDSSKFDSCLDSGKYAAEVAKDMRDGSAAGVTGTPAYFINGVFLSGAQPYENFAEIIDEELQRLGK